MTGYGRLLPIVASVALPLRRLVRGLSLGVRAAAFDGGGRVLLVRHTYTPGWHLPGGGVEPGETAADALARELMEEGGIALSGEPQLFAVYLNRRVSRRDHVLLFLCREWTETSPSPVPNFEIAEAGFFSPGALPDDATEATRRRLAEILEGAERTADW